MALVIAYKPINMSNLSVWFGTVDTATSNAIVITDYSTNIGVYIGSGFTYKNNAVTGGTLSAYGSYTYQYPNYLSDPVYTVTELSLSAATVYSYVQTNRATQLSIFALAGNDTFLGSAGDDYLIAHSGNDTLDGGTGNDTLVGGAGDDVYYVDSANDVVVEVAKDNKPSQEKFSMGNNNDVIVASVSYTLAESVTGIEDVMATGAATGSDTNNPINLTGNSSGQALIGNNAGNTLNGMKGDDQLIGGAGNDFLIGGDGKDAFFSGAGDDTISGDAGDDIFTFNYGVVEGYGLSNQPLVDYALTGGSDYADGGGGTDTLLIKGSLDNYTISRLSETEYKITVKPGINGISSSEEITFKNIENLLFGDLSKIGSSKGTIALTSINIASDYADKLTAPSALAWSINGLGGNDSITGGKGNDTLDGGTGNDTLVGGAGNDFFDFSTPLNATNNIDTITDFQVGDKIRLENEVMNALQINVGALLDGAFYNGKTAHDADDRIIYDKSSGKLFYDADGNTSGGVDAIQIGLVGVKVHADLRASHFLVI